MVRLFFSLLVLADPGHAQTLSDLDWMAGRWATESDRGEVTVGHWTPAAGPKMFGASRSFVNGVSQGVEHISIAARKKGIFHFRRLLPRVRRDQGSSMDRRYDLPESLLVRAYWQSGNLKMALEISDKNYTRSEGLRG